MKKCHFPIMIARDDHPKAKSLYFQAKMNTMQVQEVEQKEDEEPNSNDNSIQDSNDNSEFEINDFKFATYHYKRDLNGETDQEYTVGCYVNSIEDLQLSLKQIGEKILDGEITIAIEKHVQLWDDVPSPKEEEIQRAIELCDPDEAIEIEIPKSQITESPSWD